MNIPLIYCEKSTNTTFNTKIELFSQPRCYSNAIYVCIMGYSQKLCNTCGFNGRKNTLSSLQLINSILLCFKSNSIYNRLIKFTHKTTEIMNEHCLPTVFNFRRRLSDAFASNLHTRTGAWDVRLIALLIACRLFINRDKHCQH